MKVMPEEINAIRQSFEAYIIINDITLQKAAELVGWKTAPSVHKFLSGKQRPNQRRLYRIKKLIEGNHVKATSGSPA